MNLLAGRALRKTYKLGKHNEVQALRGVDVAIAEPARWSRSWGRPGPARAR